MGAELGLRAAAREMARNREGKEVVEGDPGAKSVLAAVATFADENGYAYCGHTTCSPCSQIQP